MKRIIIPIILISAFFSCNGQQPKSLEQIMEDIETAHYYIPDSVYSFFSDVRNLKQDTKLVIASTNATITEKDTLPYLPYYLTTSYLFKVYEFSDIDKKENLTKKYAHNSLLSTRSQYENYDIISSERNLLKFLGDSLMKENFSNIKIDNTIALFSPLIYETSQFSSFSNKCGLKDGYIINVLNYGTEFVLPEKYKFEWEILPPEMRHGYLSGVAYNEDEPYIIYWVTAW